MILLDNSAFLFCFLFLWFCFFSRKLNCGRHNCTQVCHPQPCQLCPRLPQVVYRCPCGQTPLSKLLELGCVERKICTDPIPSCGKTCGKPLSCGSYGNQNFLHQTIQIILLFFLKKAVLNCIISRNKYFLSDLGILTELSVKATACNVKACSLIVRSQLYLKIRQYICLESTNTSQPFKFCLHAPFLYWQRNRAVGISREQYVPMSFKSPPTSLTFLWRLVDVNDFFQMSSVNTHFLLL